MDAWIDTYHAVRGLVRGGTFVFLTDSAVGAREEDNLRHLVINLGSDVPRGARRAVSDVEAPARVLPDLRRARVAAGVPVARRARRRPDASGRRAASSTPGSFARPFAPACPDLTLGGWANPHADAAAQVGYLVDGHFTAEFFLTQIVSHHDRRSVDAFLNEAARRGVAAPGLFGVFYYRSANAKTLAALQQFLPVPVEALTREFAAGASPEDVCARTIAALRAAGVRRVSTSRTCRSGGRPQR